MSEHTDGPWFVWGGTKLIIKAKNRVIACASQEREDDWEKAKANARLIASAPELLEALEELAVFVDNDGDEWEIGKSLDKAWSAIAKAKGE